MFPGIANARIFFFLCKDTVIIEGEHTNITKIAKNKQTMFCAQTDDLQTEKKIKNYICWAKIPQQKRFGILQ